MKCSSTGAQLTRTRVPSFHTLPGIPSTGHALDPTVAEWNVPLCIGRLAQSHSSWVHLDGGTGMGPVSDRVKDTPAHKVTLFEENIALLDGE